MLLLNCLVLGERCHMLFPVVGRFGDDRDHILDFLTQSEARPCWKIQSLLLTAHADILDNDGTQQPQGHLFTVAFHPNPTRRRTDDRTSRDHANSPLKLTQYTL